MPHPVFVSTASAPDAGPDLARQTSATKDKPVDAVIMAIIDQWSLGNESVYTKD